MSYKCCIIALTVNFHYVYTYEAINYGVIDISDIENHEVELAIILLDFIDENITDEKDELDKIIDNTKSAEALSEILDILNDMTNDILKTIDKIAN